MNTLERQLVMEKMIRNLKRSELFKGLGNHEIKQVCSFTTPIVREYKKNQIICHQREVVSKIGIIESGSVISMKYHFDGEVQILRIYKPNDIISLDTVGTTLMTSPASLISQTECSILFIPYSKLLEIDRIDPVIKDRILLNINQILCNELVRLLYKIDVLSKRTLQDRVLTFLSIMKEKQDQDCIEISMNQGEFAQYLCVNRSVLSKELNQMRKSGLIDYHKNKYFLYTKDSSSGKENS